ncbi:siderophore ABC transporter substrate-binding protein [Neotamlana laminarinivorans]|uniref:Siderophore ABC transporter substrate-binding protein n=1 Tax=Neotamlana laminarinivorans TaxID=2883124 RepID=A0A9X1I239_9FLAO|nr:siderophore ABC transporter substrate-binding protein [Tamlana laminarinivorans]MCB4800020.1 siderophore ABC transporter substrate-binding protein [Tamlana laminarinivorans]
MYKSIKNKAIILLSAMVLVACKNKVKQDEANKPAKETVTITHKLGTVNVVKNPKRVVALNYSSLENLDELGINVIGIPKSHVPKYLQSYKDDESVANLGTIFEIDFEKLNSLEPDVIFMSARMEKHYAELSRIAPTIFLTSDPSDLLGSFETNISIFGKLFNKQEETNNLVTRVNQKVETLNAKAQASGKTALIILFNNGKFSAFGKASRFGVIHNLFGFKEALENLSTNRHGQAVSNELIQEANPDYLFIVDRSAVVNKKATNKAEIENALIQQTKAYKNGNIVYLDPEAWYLSGDGIASFEIMINDVNINF